MDSSRIFVRGLPPTLTESEFRKHFAIYSVTDAKLFPKRRIGYIGYKAPEDAVKAVKHFNKSFIRMSKLHVELARSFVDQSLPKSRQQIKQEKKSSIAAKHVPSEKQNPLKRKRLENEEEQDPKLKEFLDVMQPPSKAKSWANEQGEAISEILPQAKPTVRDASTEDNSDDEYQSLSKKLKDPVEHHKKSNTVVLPETRIMEDPHEEKIEAESDEESVHPVDMAVISDTGPLSDAEWLRSHTNRVLDLKDDDEAVLEVEMSEDKPNTPSPTGDTNDGQEEQQVKEDKSNSVEEDIRKTGRLFLRNLAYDVTEDDLRSHFSNNGSLDEVHVPVNNKSGSSKGFAYLQFRNPDDAVQAYSQNDGIVYQGRLLHILAASVKRETQLDEFTISKLPLKKQREIKKKQSAPSSTFNWNALYLNQDAVMSSVADRLGISKAELLDPTSSDAAIKQAHAETHIISETKAYFAQQGVDLEAFRRSSKGDTAILVKNIPHGTSPEEVRKLFEEHGSIKRFLMPPAGMTAIVEFANPGQAKLAFKSLAYRKIRDSILFLEKAPKNLFQEEVKAPASLQGPRFDQPNTKLSASQLLQDDQELESVETATVFVRNLNFSTTTQRLKEVFAPLEGFQSARVKTKQDPKRGTLSMGFGFLEFKSAANAVSAIKSMDGYSLDGHQLQLRASHKGADAAEERRKEDKAKKVAGTKIIIKNLPFEASRKDVRALFAPYGQLRSIRVPKKFDSSSRGFGFAEFTTKREAANAVEALGNTHLLGRRLVLQFAEVETDDAEKELEKMQQKVGSQANKVALQHLTSGGRKKFNVSGTDDLDEA